MIFFPVTVFRLTMAAAVADRCVEVLLGDLVELLLRGDVFDEAALPGIQPAQSLITHLLGGRDHILGKLFDLPARHVVFRDCLFHVHQRLALGFRELDLGLGDVEHGALDAALVAVEDRQGDVTPNAYDTAF